MDDVGRLNLLLRLVLLGCSSLVFQFFVGVRSHPLLVHLMLLEVGWGMFGRTIVVRLRSLV